VQRGQQTTAAATYRHGRSNSDSCNHCLRTKQRLELKLQNQQSMQTDAVAAQSRSRHTTSPVRQALCRHNLRKLPQQLNQGTRPNLASWPTHCSSSDKQALMETAVTATTAPEQGNGRGHCPIHNRACRQQLWQCMASWTKLGGVKKK